MKQFWMKIDLIRQRRDCPTFFYGNEIHEYASIYNSFYWDSQFERRTNMHDFHSVRNKEKDTAGFVMATSRLPQQRNLMAFEPDITLVGWKKPDSHYVLLSLPAYNADHKKINNYK